MADYEEVQSTIERFMKAFYDKKTKERYKLLDDFRGFLLAEPHPPYLNLDQIDYVLAGEEEDGGGVGGLCGLCAEKSGILKTIKRSASKALQLIHSLMFSPEYFLRQQFQDEFRGLSVQVFVGMDLGAHFKEG